MIYISCENRPRHLPLFLHEAREKRKYLLNMRSNSFALYALKCEQFLSIQIARREHFWGISCEKLYIIKYYIKHSSP
jgi:hypothetical protein